MNQMSCFRRSLRALLLIAAFSGRLDASPPAASGLRVVAITGGQPPGVPTEYVFTNSWIGVPVLNNAGQVAFPRSFGSPQDDFGIGVWAETDENLRLIAANGIPAPGRPNEVITFPPSSFDSGGFAFNDRGQVVFFASVGPANDPSSSVDGVWIGDGESVSLVTSGSFSSPLKGSDAINIGEGPVINRNGAVAFQTYSLDWPTYPYYQEVLWTANDNGLTQKAVTGVEIDLNMSPPLEFYDLTSPILNRNGHVSFFAVEKYRGFGIWVNDDGKLDSIALDGKLAPGLAGDVHFDFNPDFGATFYRATMNATGDMLFFNRLVGSSVNANNSDSLWRWHSGELSLVAREGDQAPGMTSGVTFNAFQNLIGPSGPVLSDSNDFAFMASLRGDGIDAQNRLSIWKVTDDGFRLVAQTGSLVPDFDSGATFDYLETPMLNDDGRIAFYGQARYRDEDGEIRQFLGIWAEDESGSLQLVVRQGQVVDTDQGPNVDLKTIVDFALPRPDRFFQGRWERDQPHAFNNSGQIAFIARFEDGREALLVTSPLIIPEPSGTVILLAVLILTNRVPLAFMT